MSQVNIMFIMGELRERSAFVQEHKEAPPGERWGLSVVPWRAGVYPPDAAAVLFEGAAHTAAVCTITPTASSHGGASVGSSAPAVARPATNAARAFRYRLMVTLLGRCSRGR